MQLFHVASVLIGLLAIEGMAESFDRCKCQKSEEQWDRITQMACDAYRENEHTCEIKHPDVLYTYGPHYKADESHADMAHLIASSPLSSPPPTRSSGKSFTSALEATSYRRTRELPFELAQHVQTYYEEQLFTQAYNFLLSITSNSASSLNRSTPVTIPPPSHLALAATIAIHPVFTTRTHSREKWDQANAALRLLRLVHKTVGPVNADFAEAFSFRKYDFRSSRHGGGGVRFDDEDDEASGNDDLGEHGSNLNTPYSGIQSLWAGAEDFWQLVGWAFNCACLPGIHAARWTHYRLLLEFLVDVLETDWHLRNAGSNPSPEENLIWQYIELAAGGHARARRIVRSIFADGSTRSTSEFRPIFVHELKEPVAHDAKIKKREVDVDIENEIYGDYLANDDSDLSDDADGASTGTGVSGRPSKRLRTRTGTRTPSARSSNNSLRSDYDNDGDAAMSSSTTALGDPSCVNLRLRLLRLLTHISSHPSLTSTSPTTFPDLEDLFTLFVEFIKPLPLPVLTQVVLTAQVFDAHTHTLLCESLLQRILENSAPAIRSNVLLSQSKLEEEYLPFAAGRNSIDANARVSLLLEALTRSLAQLSVLKKSGALIKAVDRGVERRMSKVADLGDAKRRKKAGKGEEEAWSWLVESGERLSRTARGLDET
ncbi:hypothetical protein LTR10_013357 [Elasticomyces elasticus]|uniref:Uncharacterized protein n=1 Tax=Exophiala sideris TaxID=1016849 RepID=A0ABR0J5B2_9EURO|nr:hypothetical protein LTR10_013357 [Elasticomyces elasticus]KAK5027414.1 hypothetical protein LTS07_007016 [Exophiala sideris]KAK5034884.1 hypothetical protein LTR13_006066 [Exophiala sideris]KAK5056382.1 hypothetical protein LTR69_007923 [Exophiala sideris]KAK5181129.1 hypothetical protein LTR44_006460 [Eurotiomycetes sp. CCFEE 6388]